ncbi:MAG: hypothetical protein V7640_2099, partial [Betaproteobacteria bacterium]
DRSKIYHQGHKGQGQGFTTKDTKDTKESGLELVQFFWIVAVAPSGRLSTVCRTLALRFPRQAPNGVILAYARIHFEFIASQWIPDHFR